MNGNRPSVEISMLMCQVISTSLPTSVFFFSPNGSPLIFIFTLPKGSFVLVHLLARHQLQQRGSC